MLADQLTEIVAQAGLIGPGFANAGPFPEVAESLASARESGRAASLGFTFTDPARSSDVTSSWAWAKTLVTAASAYLPAGGSPGSAAPGTGVIARFATDDHYRPLRAGLDRVADHLRSSGYLAEVLVDDSRLVDRAAAVRSGIGWWGKSAMVLMPGAGPWTLLGCVVTDAEIDPTPPMRRDCGTCDACIPACPTGAIVAPGVLDARRCLAAISQARGSIPAEFREAMGDRIYGCDECLVACPPGGRLAQESVDRRGRVDLLEVLATADRPLRRHWAHFYVPRHDARYLRRNAIVALANGGDRRHVAVIAGLLGHPDPLLRAHAAWGLGRLGGSRARAALTARRAMEADVEVQSEIDAALGSLG